MGIGKADLVGKNNLFADMFLFPKRLPSTPGSGKLPNHCFNFLSGADLAASQLGDPLASCQLDIKGNLGRGQATLIATFPNANTSRTHLHERRGGCAAKGGKRSQKKSSGKGR